MTPILTSEAPAAVGPYSQAMQAGNLVFLSGQIPLDPATGVLVGEDIAEQTEQVLKNVQAVLQAAGLGFSNVIKSTIFLVDLGHFEVVNKLYAQYFGEHRPARSTIQVVALPKGARVEIECVALRA